MYVVQRTAAYNVYRFKAVKMPSKFVWFDDESSPSGDARTAVVLYRGEKVVKGCHGGGGGGGGCVCGGGEGYRWW